MEEARMSRVNGFTLIELMVVVVILLVLAAILLPALSGITDSGKEIAAQAQLSGLKVASTKYATELSRNPGIVDEVDFAGRDKFSGNENLVVSLMGQIKKSGDATGGGEKFSMSGLLPESGYVVDIEAIGEGPRTLSAQGQGRKYGAFYGAKANELAVINEDSGGNNMPELIDPWQGLPLLYFRRLTSDKSAALVGHSQPTRSRWDLGTHQAYLDARAMKSSSGRSYTIKERCLLSGNSNDSKEALAWLIAHLKLSEFRSGPMGDDVVESGSMLFISPGKDAAYLPIPTGDGAETRFRKEKEWVGYRSEFKPVFLMGGTAQ